MYILPTLYKRNSNGSVQQWTMIVEHNKYWAEYGQVAGKIQSDKPTVAKPKNVGKSNETTPEEQAILEAESKWTKKIDRQRYFESIKDIDQFQFKPTLAHKADVQGHKLEGKLISATPKLDGIRCYITKDGAFSRRDMKFVTTKIIEEDLKPFFDKFPNAILDGELYNHKYKEDFNQITSLVRKTKNITGEDWAFIADNLQFHLFDVPRIADLTLKDTFIKRMTRFQEVFGIGEVKFNTKRFFIVVDEIFEDFSFNDERFQEYKAAVTEEGYEGVMVRDMNMPYEMKRSYKLQKVKDFVDDEFTIVDITEGDGNRSGMAGRVICEINGDTFEANMRGSHDYFTELLKNRNIYIGKQATIRYQNLTPDGQPRFGVMVAIRDYE